MEKSERTRRPLPSFRTLRLVATVLPIAFALGFGLFIDQVLEKVLPYPLAHVAAALVVAVAAVLFATWIFGLLARMYQELEDRQKAERRRAQEWQELFETGREIVASPQLPPLLDAIVRRAGGLLGAEAAYVMLCEGDDTCVLRMSASHGLRGAPDGLTVPGEECVEGLVMETGAPVTVEDPLDKRLSPRQRKLMEQQALVSQVSVPLAVKGKLLGTLTVADRGPAHFTERCVELLSAFANWAAVAVETSRLYAQVGCLARMEERERIGVELHDAVIQSIYAVQLNLEDCLHQVQESPEQLCTCLGAATQELDRVVEYMRRYIFGLRPYLTDAQDLPRALRDLVEEVRVNTTIDAELKVTGHLDGSLTEEQARALFQIAREALSNASHHAAAASVRLELSVLPEEVALAVLDNGIGFESETPEERRGLREMAARAAVLNGRFSIESANGMGTRVSVRVPLRKPDRETDGRGCE
jgi:two-component system sensor histidine kinase DevS